MWWNTLGFFGAVITPTKLDRLDSSCAALAITRCGWSAWSCASIGDLARAVGQLRRPRRQHRVDEQAVAARGGDAAGAGVRAGDQAELLEIGHHVADRRRRQLEAAGARQRARADRLAVGDVAFDQGLQQGLGALVEHGSQTVAGAFSPASRKRSLWCNPANGDPLPARCARRQVQRRRHPRGARTRSRSSWSRRASRSRSKPRPRATPASTPDPRSMPRRSAPRATSPSSLGGDGTMLGIARQLARHGTPLVGINQGRLGFITDIAVGGYEAALAPILAGDYDEEQRAMLEGDVERDGARIFEGFALNDVIVSRGATAGMVELQHRDRRRVRRQPARRRPDRRLADRLDRLCAVGRRADPASGHRRLGAGADRAARPLEPADRACPTPARCAIEIVAGRDASVNFDMQSLDQPAARRPDPRAPLGRTACASCIRAAGATTRPCAASCTGPTGT